MKYRRPRITLSVACGIACLLLIVLWVRSYRYVEAIRLMAAPNGGVIQCLSIPGSLAVGIFKSAKPWSYFQMSASEWRRVMATAPASQLPSPTWGGRLTNSVVDQFFVPYWILVLSSAVTASLPGLRWRFSLRTLLIAATLVAIVLGIVVCVSATRK
jgi:hypothetical protein